MVKKDWTICDFGRKSTKKNTKRKRAIGLIGY